jgi:hypothetical protein
MKPLRRPILRFGDERSKNEGASDAMWSRPHHDLHYRQHWPRLGAPSHASAELAPELGALVALHGGVETVGDRAATTSNPMQFPRLLSRLRSSYRLQSLRHLSFRHRRPRVRQVVGNTAIGTPSIASTRATIALTWGRGHNEGCQRCSGPCLKWSSIFSTSRRQASCSRGPAVFSTAIWR